MVNHMFRNTFPILSFGLVVLQTTEILGLIIYFAIHFLCVTIE